MDARVQSLMCVSTIMQSGLVWSGLARSVLPAAPALRLAGTDRGLILSSSIFLYSCFFSFLCFFFTDTQTTVSTTIHHYTIFFTFAYIHTLPHPKKRRGHAGGLGGRQESLVHVPPSFPSPTMIHPIPMPSP
ncbi:hypothetical protein CCHR01_06448 [Colletotrichum chrysophilum]|uniref:Uncharacterized protein n=1 Tax=Colletotrichum chrysophilum TaxID=1836956 RepID=A0AAD9ANQ6_9PEZI|nr:hypothetical protein CCHR01_06448 [Colletotrichum chrysophilum]